MRFLLALCVTGCNAILGVHDFEPGRDAVEGDAPSSDAIDASTECLTWKPHFFEPCALPAPMDPALAGVNYTLDTDAVTLRDLSTADIPIATYVQKQLDGSEALVLVVRSLVVPTNAIVRVVGTRPLVIAAFDSITLQSGSIIDASSERANPNPIRGAGAGDCAGGNGVDADIGGGSGGGAGGSMRGVGGTGGPGDDLSPSAGGMPTAARPLPTSLAGGCRGGNSGTAGPGATNPSAFAIGGLGGGAVHLAARSLIALGNNAQILAGGAGGNGAPSMSSAGGAGGGAGGFIGIEAPSIVEVAFNYTFEASGGGGGGSTSFVGPTAPSGEDGSPNDVAHGGAAAVGNCAGAGANGSSGQTFDGASASQTLVSCGGGGGGGAGGWIAIYNSAQLSGSITPPPFMVTD